MELQLSPAQINDFIKHGFVRIDDAFPASMATEARAILWKETGLDPEDPSCWKHPVVRLGYYTQEPFVAAANTPLLLKAFDQLVGVNNWIPCRNMGSMVLRFPSDEIPADTGWHVDAGFPGDEPHDYLNWRINMYSKGRGLLMLFLFSDVGEQDAPTRIRAGSHKDMAAVLMPYGEKGLSFMELAGLIPQMPEREEVLATGMAGTVYLCHPFLVHAAQAHRGNTPRFLAQPPLALRKGLVLDDDDNSHQYTPVEMAIREGLGTH